METIRRTKIVDLLKREDFGAMVNVKGWVRTRRGSKQVNFIALNDGSTINNVQIVVDLANFDIIFFSHFQFVQRLFNYILQNS
jgi:asparaginyl-tRNA synthetase